MYIEESKKEIAVTRDTNISTLLEISSKNPPESNSVNRKQSLCNIMNRLDGLRDKSVCLAYFKDKLVD